MHLSTSLFMSQFIFKLYIYCCSRPILFLCIGLKPLNARQSMHGLSLTSLDPVLIKRHPTVVSVLPLSQKMFLSSILYCRLLFRTDDRHLSFSSFTPNLIIYPKSHHLPQISSFCSKPHNLPRFSKFDPKLCPII